MFSGISGEAGHPEGVSRDFQGVSSNFKGFENNSRGFQGFSRVLKGNGHPEYVSITGWVNLLEK